MAIKSDEIISILKAQIEGFDGSAESRTVGTLLRWAMALHRSTDFQARSRLNFWSSQTALPAWP